MQTIILQKATEMEISIMAWAELYIILLSL